jgi:hypothetical protein
VAKGSFTALSTDSHRTLDSLADDAASLGIAAYGESHVSGCSVIFLNAGPQYRFPRYCAFDLQASKDLQITKTPRIRNTEDFSVPILAGFS